MRYKKWLTALFFPHPALLLLLLPLGSALLVYALLFLPELAPLRIGSYVLAFYTLVVWCLRLPAFLRSWRRLWQENRLLHRWQVDARLRANVTLTASVLWNGGYAVFQGFLGYTHRSTWFYALAAYSLSLALMRLFLVGHTLRHEPGQLLGQELRRSRLCGWLLLLLNSALAGMLVHMVRDGRVVRHSSITTIALAAYTFVSLGLAIYNVIRYRAYHSPALSASKVISLTTACVSMLTLENTMLDTFSGGELSPGTRRLFLSLSGGALSIFILLLAIHMIVQAEQTLHTLEVNHERT